MNRRSLKVPLGREPYRAWDPDAPPLAELIAAAVVASARSFGDDAIKAAKSTDTRGRRSLTAAASGLERAHVCSLATACRLLSLNPQAASQARRRAGAEFLRAEGAAGDAADALIERALQPQANVVASVVPPATPPVVSGIDLASGPDMVVEATIEAGVVTCVTPIPPPVARPDAPPSATSRPAGRVVSIGAARRALRGELAVEPGTAADLVERTGLSEQTVRGALTAMSDAGEAVADPLTMEGEGARFWRLRRRA